METPTPQNSSQTTEGAEQAAELDAQATGNSKQSVETVALDAQNNDQATSNDSPIPTMAAVNKPPMNSMTSNYPPSGSTQQLIDFVPTLEDYIPTIPDAVTASFLHSAGFASSDPRVLRLISLAAQKFISDISNDALQHCKVRTSNQTTKSKTKEKTYTLTMDDLTPALEEHGILLRKPPYYV